MVQWYNNHLVVGPRTYDAARMMPQVCATEDREADVGWLRLWQLFHQALAPAEPKLSFFVLAIRSCKIPGRCRTQTESSQGLYSRGLRLRAYTPLALLPSRPLALSPSRPSSLPQAYGIQPLAASLGVSMLQANLRSLATLGGWTLRQHLWPST